MRLIITLKLLMSRKKRRTKMKLRSQIVKEISDRIAEYKVLMIDHDNNQDAVNELESAVHELENLLEWINE
jgi:allophanate hydrolase subunit 1